MEINCPQCDKVLKAPSSRLVQDSCGHKKCRMCLLQDESECRMCLQQIGAEGCSKTEEQNVIKYENNHAAVITCNKSVAHNITDIPEVRNKADHMCTQLHKNGVQSKVNMETSDKQELNRIKCGKPQRNEQKRAYKCITLPSHILVLTENPVTYKCSICKKSFRTKAHIKYHSYCAGDRKPLQCEECNKEFISKYHLETHRLGHTDKKVYVCDVCDKKFKQYGILNRHKLIHSESKQYVCQQCGKMFKSKEYLQRHSLIHETEKNFSCNQCDAKFNNRSNLNKHQAIHSKEKIHMCDECGKRFKFKGALTVHRRSHTRLRPHKCTNCFKTFVNAKELHRHQLIHSDVKGYACSLCSVSFRRKDNLQRHVRNTHPGRKATFIKKPSKRVRVKRTQPEAPAENPNAIKVITASPTCAPSITKSEPVLSKPVPVINAPLKLAFKTTAFKSHYNIHSREYVEPPRIHPKPYDYAESVSICQKILSPSSPPQTRTIIKTLGKVSEKESTEICQKILSPIIPPIISDPALDKAHSIRNIKFKLPSKYINLSKKNIFNDINTLKSIDYLTVSSENEPNKNAVYTELKPLTLTPTNAASVIVNTQSTTQNEMHWRRRTLQNLEMQSKQTEY